jgi:hypothetical protein
VKFVGGPHDGRENGVVGEVGEEFNAPGRNQIDGRWYSVSHIYEVGKSGDAEYKFSQYEHKS